MALGFNSQVLKRIWHTLVLLQKGEKRADIKVALDISDRLFLGDIARLKKMGIALFYRRASDTYDVRWPTDLISLRMQPEELFYYFYLLSVLSLSDGRFNEIKKKLELAVIPESSPVYDCGPAYGISQNVNGLSSELLSTLSVAIESRHKVVFFYKKPNGESQLREVHPYKLLHTPISWYLAAWCVDGKQFRNFKLARMGLPKILTNTYQPQDFNLSDHLGDAWWVRFDNDKINNPYHIKILFKGDSAQTIKEYRFHKTQKESDSDEGTIVEWYLSYLDEFASWLMQWLGQIEILAPKELLAEVNRRKNI